MDKMNANEKNVSADQHFPISQETALQSEDLSSFNDVPITSSLQAGINYCRSMADQMVDEIKSLQEQYDSTRQTNKVLKQNLVNLENEKQQLIADFQEDFRKFNALNSCVKGLENEVLCLKEFLDPSMKLEADITSTRIEELKIRSSVLQAPLEEQENRLQKIESSVLDLLTNLTIKKKKVEVFNSDLEILNDIDKKLESHVDRYDFKIRNLISIDDFTHTKGELERTIDSLREECCTRTVDAQKKKAEMCAQIKIEFDVLRSQEAFQKDKIRSGFSVKRNILDDLKMKVVDKLKQIEELYRRIKTEEDAIQNLDKEIELLGNELRRFENKLPPLEQEKVEINEVLEGLLREIQCLKEEQSSHTEERENLQQNIELLKIKEETVKNNLEVLKDKIELNNKLTEIVLLKNSCEEENRRLENEKQQLLREKEYLESENANLIREVSAENQRHVELQKILQMKEVFLASNDENESEVLDQLRIIKTEEYSLIDLKEAEFDAVADKFEQISSNLTDLEFSLSQVLRDNDLVEEEIRSKHKILKIIYQDNEELSKRYNMMVNGKNVEIERVDKLKKEIASLKGRLNSKKESTRVGAADSFSPDNDFSLKGKKSKN